MHGARNKLIKMFDFFCLLFLKFGGYMYSTNYIDNFNRHNGERMHV